MSIVIGIEFTVSGRLGSGLLTRFPGFAARSVPAHTVLLVDADPSTDLVSLLRLLEDRGVEVLRVEGTIGPGTRDG